MAAITATSYATPSVQAWQGRARLNQIRQQADEAEANARQLRTQADQADQESQSDQAQVRSVSAQVAQADSTYSAQLLSQTAASQAKQVQSFLRPALTSAPVPFNPTGSVVKAGKTPWSGVNLGSSSGRFVNLSV